MFFAVDVIEKVDRIFDDAITNITVVSAAFGIGRSFGDDDALAQLTVQINFVIPSFEKLPLGLWFVFIFVFVAAFSPLFGLDSFNRHLLILLTIPLAPVITRIIALAVVSRLRHLK